MKQNNILNLFLLCATLLYGQNSVGEDIRIVGTGGSGKISISLQKLKTGQNSSAKMFYSVLMADLKNSGWFSVVAKPNATIQVGGACLQRGDKLVVSCEVRNTSTGKRYFSRAFTNKSSESRQLAHQISDAIVSAVKGVPGIASSKIVMISSRNGKKDVAICGSDGKDIIQLTRDGAPCLSPTWDPNAENIYYTSFYRGFPDVYRINLSSGRRSKVASYPGINAGADISPNGKLMALTLSKDGNPELYIRNLSTGKLTRMTQTKNAAEASPSWSPDGRQIAFVSDSTGSPQIYTISSTGGKPKRITFRGNENVSPDWAANGKIAYSSRRSGRYQICVFDPQKGQEVQITSDYVDHEQPSWAPDSRHIVYTHTEGFRSAVYVLDTLGDPQVRLTQFKGDWYSPDWSPR